MNPAPIHYSDLAFFAGTPDVTRLLNGDCIVTARDTSKGLWVDIWRQNTRDWLGWRKTDLVAAGDPAVVGLEPGSAIVAVRDDFGGYWTQAVDRDLKFGKATKLGGQFQSDPSLASCPDGGVVISGVDRSHVLWSAILTREGAFSRPWVSSGALLGGEVCAACGSRGPRVVARDNWGVIGLVQLSEAGQATWSNSGFLSKFDPACAAHQDSIFVTVLDDSSRLHLNRYRDTGSGVWEGWKYLGDSVESAAPAVWNGEVTVFIHPIDNSLQWWRPSSSKWQAAMWGSFVRGKLRAAPR